MCTLCTCMYMGMSSTCSGTRTRTRTRSAHAHAHAHARVRTHTQTHVHTCERAQAHTYFSQAGFASAVDQPHARRRSVLRYHGVYTKGPPLQRRARLLFNKKFQETVSFRHPTKACIPRGHWHPETTGRGSTPLGCHRLAGCDPAVPRSTVVPRPSKSIMQL